MNSSAEIIEWLYSCDELQEDKILFEKICIKHLKLAEMICLLYDKFAVCSKNTESVAKEPFEKHPDMVLRLDDIAVFMANWENKVENIRNIQNILNKN